MGDVLVSVRFAFPEWGFSQDSSRIDAVVTAGCDPDTMRKVLLLVLCASSLFAQGNVAKLVGSVKDPTGAVVPGAVIKVRNEKTGVSREVASGESGNFVVANLPPSIYDVTVVAAGMSPVEFKDVPLTAGQERDLQVTLSVAQIEQSVNVTTDLVVVDMSSARIGANVNEREVENIPLNGRALSSLYLMSPGAVSSGGGSFDNIRFSGRANQQNAVKFDGVDASAIIDASPGNLNGESSTGFRLQTSLESVQEFRVESSNFPAEQGTGTGGQISIVTKSGTNDYHAAVFEYIRNNAFDARNFFDGAGPSELRLNQFGASFGGPIKKDKLFFFTNFEALQQRAGVNIISAVPSQSARALAVPSIKPLMDAYPIGQQSSANPNLDIYNLNAATAMNEYYGNIRFDYAMSSKYNMSLRYMREQGYLSQPLDVTNNWQRVTSVAQNAMYTLNQVYSPSIINVTTLGFNGPKTRINGVAPTVNGIDTSLIYVNFTGSTAIPGIGGQGASAGAATIGGLIRSNSAQNGRGQPYTNYSYSFGDNLTVIKGNHTMKFGGEFRPVRLYTDRLGGTTYTYSNLNDLLANKPSSVQYLADVSSPNPFHNGIATNRFLSQSYTSVYAQDEWKVLPTLTINYGLRYEYYTSMRSRDNLDTIFKVISPTQGSVVANDASWYNTSGTNFAPRLGISWAPAKLKNRTVIRVGAGYYYGPGQTEDQVQPIDSDRLTYSLANAAFPIVPPTPPASVDPNKTSNFQPRGYSVGYNLPERVLSYTASIQQELPGNTLMTIAYVGSQGRNLFLRSWANVMTGVTMNPTTGAGIAVLPLAPYFAQLDYKTSGGTDHYDSLQLSVQRRFSKGLTVGGQYTYGHSLGNSGGSNEAQTSQNPYNLKGDYGNNAFDVRQTANVTALYELPLGKGRQFMSSGNALAQGLLGGWQIGGVVNVRTGLPMDVTLVRNDIAYVDANGKVLNSQVKVGDSILTTPVVNNPYGGAFRSNRRPSVVAGVDPFLHTSDKRYILNPAAFYLPAPGEYGNLGRWALHGPGLSQFDFSMQKNFNITERLFLQFNAQIYNLFNHTNFSNPPSRLNNSLGIAANQLQPGQAFNAVTGGAAFGVANATVDRTVGLGNARQIQLSVRLFF
jgi:hypothetical protein